MEYIGFIAAIFTAMSFLPQALKIIKTKDTTSISLSMYILFVLGVISWLIYGIYLGDMAIIIANIITFCFSSIVLYYKVVEIMSERKVQPI